MYQLNSINLSQDSSSNTHMERGRVIAFLSPTSESCMYVRRVISVFDSR